MNEFLPGIIPAGIFWSALTGFLTFGIWSLRKRRWIIGTACILVALPYPLVNVYGMVALNRVNTILQNGHETIYSRIINIESVLKSDTLQLKTKSRLSKLIARDHFVFEGKIENYLDEKGDVHQFSPDSLDNSLMINMKTSQKFIESITSFGLLFLSSIPVGLFAGFLLPIELKMKTSRD